MNPAWKWIVTTALVLLAVSMVKAASSKKKTQKLDVDKELQYLSARTKKSAAILTEIDNDLAKIGKRMKDLDMGMDELIENLATLETFFGNLAAGTPVQQSTESPAVDEPTTSVGYNYVGVIRDVLASGNTQSGVYSVNLESQTSPIQVYCRLEEGEAWTVIQRRVDNTVNFNQNWEGFKNGFGDLEGNFWLGNDNLHRLTNQGVYKLRVRMESWSGRSSYADYSWIKVKDEENKYQLQLGDFAGGNAGDCLAYHAYQYFSTYDRDNDAINGISCAAIMEGGWWYKSCSECSLNGLYLDRADYGGMTWLTWAGNQGSMKFVEVAVLREHIEEQS